MYLLNEKKIRFRSRFLLIRVTNYPWKNQEENNFIEGQRQLRWDTSRSLSHLRETKLDDREGRV